MLPVEKAKVGVRKLILHQFAQRVGSYFTRFNLGIPVKVYSNTKSTINALDEYVQELNYVWGESDQWFISKLGHSIFSTAKVATEYPRILQSLNVNPLVDLAVDYGITGAKFSLASAEALLF